MSTLIWVPTAEVYLKEEAKRMWNSLAGKNRKELNINKQFSPREIEEFFIFPARAVGIVMKDNPQGVCFPILERKVLTLGGLEKMIIVLVDNNQVTSAAQKNQVTHPYWGDTCTLKQVISTKFKEELELEFITVYNSNSPNCCLEALSGIQGDYLLGSGNIVTQVVKGLTGAKQLFMNPFNQDLEICP